MNNERLLSIGARLQNTTNNDGGVCFIRVPADASLPVQELVLIESSSSMETFFQNYFVLQPGESVDMELVQAQADQARKCTTYMCPHVSPLTLQRAAAEGTLQRSLLSEQENNAKLFLYYDEGAALKRREKNTRACQFVQAGGGEEEAIHGDVFLTRISDGKFISLHEEELSTQAWFSK